MTVGVLALQGDFAEHIEVLRTLRVRTMEVRTVEHLKSVHKLILPGGESTTISGLLRSTGLGKAIADRAAEGSLPIYGTCAGAILLAKTVRGKAPPRTLRLMDIVVERNAYGTQLHSFEGFLRVKGIKAPIAVAYVRAPKIITVGNDVEVLSVHEGVPMLVRQEHFLAGTFHPEVRGNSNIHQLFLDMD